MHVGKFTLSNRLSYIFVAVNLRFTQIPQAHDAFQVCLENGMHWCSMLSTDSSREEGQQQN